MLNRVYLSTRLLPSHQSHETVRAGIEAVVTRNQRTPTRGVVDNCPPCSQLEEQLRWLAGLFV